MPQMGWEDGNKIEADKEKTKACDLRLDGVAVAEVAASHYPS